MTSVKGKDAVWLGACLGIGFFGIVQGFEYLSIAYDRYAPPEFPRLEYDETDAAPSRSGFKLMTDHGTGCQYLATFTGAVTPRLDAEGVHVCVK